MPETLNQVFQIVLGCLSFGRRSSWLKYLKRKSIFGICMQKSLKSSYIKVLSDKKQIASNTTFRLDESQQRPICTWQYICDLTHSLHTHAPGQTDTLSSQQYQNASKTSRNCISPTKRSFRDNTSCAGPALIPYGFFRVWTHVCVCSPGGSSFGSRVLLYFKVLYG